MLRYEDEYNKLCHRVLSEGFPVENKRTGKVCHTVINHDFVYDIGAGELPLLTNKQCFTVSAVAEVLGYLRQYTNAQQFADIGSPTWFSNAASPVWQNNPNCKGLTDMGEAYRFGEQGYFVEIQPKLFPVECVTTIHRESKNIHYPTLPSNEDYVGKTFESSTCGEYKVIRYLGNSTDKRINYFKIEFIETGTIMIIQKSQIRNGNIKDFNATSVYGVGVLGVELTEGDRWLYKTWQHMLERCYCKTSTYYNSYGGRGVFVDKSWLIFKNFKEDVTSLENFYIAKEYPKDYSLDKDFFKSNKYSKHTCKWSSRKEQAVNTRNVKTYEVTTDEGVRYVRGLEALSNCLGVSKSTAVRKVSNEEIKLAPEDLHLSYCEVNPLKDIYCKLKNGVDDRRLISNAWLPHLQQKTCLVPCAYEHIWSLVGNKLSLTVVQRSGDLPLGIPFNSFSFAFLLKLMAKITGNVPDKVFHKIINVHVYEDQVEPLKEQLLRTPLDISPVLEISAWVDSLYDVVGDDKHAREYFTLTGYEHQGKIPFPFTA